MRDESGKGASPGDIDPEQLAKLLDGTLVGPDRDRLLAKLDGDSRARESLAEAAAVLVELREGEAKAGAPVRLVGGERRPGRFRREVWLALAAAVVFVAAIPLLQRRIGDATLPDVTLIAAGLPANAVSLPGWQGHPWRESRGGTQPLGRGGRAVRIGALIVELETVAVRGDSAARNVGLQIASLLDEYPGGSAAGDVYRALATGNRVTDPRARTDAARTAEVLAGANELRLGAWLETARIAAAGMDTAFFAAPPTAVAIKLATTFAGSDPMLIADVNELSASLQSANFDWTRISSALDALLGGLASSP